MRNRRPRLSFLGKFSLLSLLLIVGLGGVLAKVLESQIEQRALANAEQIARVTAQVGVAPRLVARDLRAPLSQLRLTQLDTELRQAGLSASGSSA